MIARHSGKIGGVCRKCTFRLRGPEVHKLAEQVPSQSIDPQICVVGSARLHCRANMLSAWDEHIPSIPVASVSFPERNNIGTRYDESIVRT